MINTLHFDADNLTLADTNEEGADLMALQTRQQISTIALTLANQSNQQVLALFDDLDLLSRHDSVPECEDLSRDSVHVFAQDPKQHHEVYFELVNNVVKTAPSTRPYLDRINNQILAGSFYKALKEAHPLVHYEQQLVSHSKTN